MEIIDRFDDTVLALIEITMLHDHEEIKPKYLEELTEQIRADGILKNPLIVDKYSNIVLDGHHRFHALKELGCKRVPAYVVDYYNPNIILDRWHPVLRTEGEVDAVLKTLKEHGFQLQPVPDKRTMKVLIESENARLGMIVESESGEKFYSATHADETYENAMQYIREALGRELDYAGGDEEMNALKEAKQISMILYVPKPSKALVVEHGTSGKPLPAKTTRHIIPNKKHYAVSLEKLRQDSPIEESD